LHADPGERPAVFEPKLFPGLSVPLEGLFDGSDFEGFEEA
jgi:hypothetical protein